LTDNFVKFLNSAGLLTLLVLLYHAQPYYTSGSYQSKVALKNP